jgi:predicted nucleotidyltransferase
MLTHILQGVQQTLADNLVGLYLRGSLAYGDFNPATSDLDLLVVTVRPIDEATFAHLNALHQRLAHLSNPYAQRLEIAYLDRATVRVFQPHQRHPTLEQGAGEVLKWHEHGQNWILERWSIRAFPQALYGPDPATLIDPIAPAEIIAAVCARLQDWVDWAHDAADPDWQLPKSHKAYVVETMCRAWYTLQTGELASKPQSVAWSLAHLPPPWQELVAQSRTWREDAQVDLSLNPRIRDFVLWVAGSARGGGG